MVPKEFSIATIIVLGILLLFAPLPEIRMHVDEAIYYTATNHLIQDHIIPAWHGTTIIPFIFWAPAIALYNSILALRAVTAVFALSTAIVIFLLGKKLFNETVGFSAALMFLFSFHTLRFGMRIGLIPIATFFGILSIYFLVYRKPIYAGIAFTLAAYSYQLWIPLLPVFMIQAYRMKLSLKQFLAPILLLATSFQSIIFLQHGFTFLKSAVETSSNVYINPFNISRAIFGWGEFLALAIIPAFGAVLSFKDNPAKWLFALIGVQFICITFMSGFMAYGGASHYLFTICALISLVGGHGIQKLWGNSKKPEYIQILTVILLVNMILVSSAIALFSTRGVNGTYDFGYEYDVQAIETLRELDTGGLIVAQTTHPLLVVELERGSSTYSDRFMWGEIYSLGIYIEKNPSLLMAYKADIRFNKNASNLKIIEIGPYVIVEGDNMKDSVEFEPANIWKWRVP